MQRILIVRLSAMGDILHALPAVTALRQALPDAWIGWAIEQRWAGLLRAERVPDPVRGPAMPLVDRLHYTNTVAWRTAILSLDTWREISTASREMRDQKYNAVIDLQGAVRSAALACVSGAPVRVGAAKPREWPARWLYNCRVGTPAIHVIEQASETASALLDRPLPSVSPELPVDPDAEKWCEQLTRGTAKFLVIAPGAGWGAKCWPPERYAAVAKELAGDGWKVFVNAGPNEFDLGSRIADSANPGIELVVSSIGQLISLTRRAALFIGGDTGPMHLAAALRIPVVAIFGPTDPRRNGPYGTPNIVLRSPSSKRDHARRAQPEPGLLTIEVDQVLRAARKLLGGT